MVGVARLELATLWSQTRCASQTALHPVNERIIYNAETYSALWRYKLYARIYPEGCVENFKEIFKRIAEGYINLNKL